MNKFSVGQKVIEIDTKRIGTVIKSDDGYCTVEFNGVNELVGHYYLALVTAQDQDSDKWDDFMRDFRNGVFDKEKE